MLTTGSESLAITVVTMVPLTALGATMPRYTDWLNTGEKSFMSWRETNTKNTVRYCINIVNIDYSRKCWKKCTVWLEVTFSFTLILNFYFIVIFNFALLSTKLLNMVESLFSLLHTGEKKCNCCLHSRHLIYTWIEKFELICQYMNVESGIKGKITGRKLRVVFY